MNAEEALNHAIRMDPAAIRYVVRLYDGFDNEWMDVSDPVDGATAKEIWDRRTLGGTKHTSYADIDYYAIFPVGTIMFFSKEAQEEILKQRNKDGI